MSKDKGGWSVGERQLLNGADGKYSPGSGPRAVDLAPRYLFEHLHQSWGINEATEV